MRVRDAIGKRIVAIKQERVTANSGSVYHVSAIVLDDGTVLSTSVAEMEGDYAVEITATNLKPVWP